MSKARASVLIFAADPSDLARLRQGDEISKVEQCLKQSTFRDRVTVRANLSTKTRDLRTQILDHRPAVVHFIGHGAGPEGLVLESEDGLSHAVPGEALAELFRLFQGTVQCVLLNSCFSKAQAEQIAAFVPCVIGMTGEIGDRAAIDFAIGFYDAVFAGQSFGRAVEFGRNAIQLESLPTAIRAALPARDVQIPNANRVDALPAHLRPVMLGNGDLVLAARQKIASRATAATGALAATAAVVWWIGHRPAHHGPDPVDPARASTTALEAVQAAYLAIEQATADASGPGVPYRRLKAALFEALPACHGQPPCLLDAALKLQFQGFFAAHGNPDVSDDLALLPHGDLSELLQCRLTWLQSDVTSALNHARHAVVPLPPTLQVDRSAGGRALPGANFASMAEVQRQIEELRGVLAAAPANDAH